MSKASKHPGVASYLDAIIAYEQGDLNQEQTIDLFASLLRSGVAWQLQGSYGRTAADLINAGVLTTKGEIVKAA